MSVLLRAEYKYSGPDPGRIRPKSGPDDGEGSEVAGAAAKLAAELRALRAAAGHPPPTLESLVSWGARQTPKVKLSDASLSAWMRPEQPTVPKDERVLLALVAHLASKAGLLQDMDRWKRMHRDAWNETHVNRGGRAAKTARTTKEEGALTERPAAAFEHPTRQVAENLSRPKAWDLRRIKDCTPLMLGLDRMLESNLSPPPGSTDAWQELVPYIERSFDQTLRARLQRAASAGGFVLLVGDSATGKTRSLYQALREVIPESWILFPKDSDGIREALPSLPERTVIWLDDSPQERFIGAEVSNGLGPFEVRQLIDTYQMIIVDTFWRSRYREILFPPDHTVLGPETGSSREARAVLELAGLPIEVPDLNETERSRARAIATTDHRILDALNDEDFGFTQHLAGAPEQVRRWIGADRFARAVLDACVDIARLGITAPWSTALLKDAARQYLERAEVSDSLDARFNDAIRYVSSSTERGTRIAVLQILRDDGRESGPLDTLRLTDYPLQYGLRVRHFEIVAHGLWRVLARHIEDPSTLRQLGWLAELRGLLSVAELFYISGFQKGDLRSIQRLVYVVSQQDREDDLMALLVLNSQAAVEISRRLLASGSVDQLRSLALKTGHVQFVGDLMDYLAKSGPTEALEFFQAVYRTAVDGNIPEGTSWAGEFLPAMILARYGYWQELEVLAQQGDHYARRELESRTDASNRDARRAGRDTADDEDPTEFAYPDPPDLPIALLRERAATGDLEAETGLVRALLAAEKVDELRDLVASTGRLYTNNALALLFERLDRKEDLLAFRLRGLLPSGKINRDASEEDVRADYVVQHFWEGLRATLKYWQEGNSPSD